MKEHKVLKGVRWLFTVVAVTVVAFVISERQFLGRYFTYAGDPLVLPISLYSPVEGVGGEQVDDVLPAKGSQRTIRNAILTEIAAYAKSQGSQGLIVVHDGAIQLEAYWHNTSRETRFNLQSMSKPGHESVGGLLGGDKNPECCSSRASDGYALT
ncbi:MAG: hypothetical protein OSB02_11315 [Rhodospirillaceae bacterium]|nr:hypothetical protein [Rhodospirillaceae bacterium]